MDQEKAHTYLGNKVLLNMLSLQRRYEECIHGPRWRHAV